MRIICHRQKTTTFLIWNCTSFLEACCFLTNAWVHSQVSKLDDAMRRTMASKALKNAKVYIKLSIIFVSKDIPPRFGYDNYQIWRSCTLGCSKLSLQLDTAVVETRLDIHSTTKWVTWNYTLDKWLKIGTEANTTPISIGIEMLRLPNDKRNSDKHIVRPAHKIHRTIICVIEYSSRSNVDNWGAVYRFDSTRTYCKPSKGYAGQWIHPMSRDSTYWI